MSGAVAEMASEQMATQTGARNWPAGGGEQLGGHALWLAGAVAALVAILLRLPFRTHIPLSWDSVQYILGVLDYDVALHQPHPPGYFLYVHSAKLLHLLGLRPYSALVALSVLGGALMVGLLAWWCGRLLGKRGAIIAAALCLFSPLAWVYATHGDTYALSGFFSALVGYLCWRVLTDGRAAVWPAALALGLAGGFRPTDALFLLPLWLWSVRRRGWGQAGLGLMVFGLVTVAWLAPMVASAGGIASYRETSQQLSQMVMGLSVLQGNAGAFRVFVSYFLGSGAALLLAAWPLALFAGKGNLPRVMNDSRAWLFLVIWSLPAILFYLLVHLGQAGYMMMLLPPAVLVVTTGVVRLGESLSGSQFWVLLAVLVLLNSVFTWATLITDDRRLEASFAGVAGKLSAFSGADTVALAGVGTLGEARTERRMLSFRLAMYLFPHVPVYSFPLEKSLRGGGSPNYGHQMTSARVAAPVTLRGVRNLLLLDPELRERYLAGVPVRRVWDDDAVQISLVRLNPAVAVTIGPEGRLEFSALPPAAH